MSPRARLLLLFAALVAGAGCTFEPGRWFGVLRPSLTAGWRLPADRDAGEGWQRLSNDYQVKASSATIELGDVPLLAVAGGGGAVRFDPASPPPGYSLCHNGHCHAADGRLVPYAEIEAELAGGRGGAGLTTAVTLRAPGVLDLLAASVRTLSCNPACNLDRTRILRASATVGTLSIEGTVRDGRQPPRIAEMPFRWRLTGGGDAGPAPPTLEAELDLPIDGKHPPLVDLGLRVELSPAVFDGVDFGALPPVAGALDLAPAEDRLRANLAEGRFMTAAIARREE
jgi:hypothetical protein